MALSSKLSSQFEALDPADQEAILNSIGNEGEENPVLRNFKAPSGRMVNGPVFADQSSSVGALSAGAAPQEVEPPAPTHAAKTGALSMTPFQGHSKPIDVQAMMAQFVPQDDSRSKYLALAAAFGAPTKSGTFGETLSNVASALQEQRAGQEKLRAQYVPLIMQQVARQQQAEEQAQYKWEAQQAQIAAQQQAQQERLQAQAQQAAQHQELIRAIAQGNQGLRADANATTRANMITKAMEQYPFGIPPAVQAQIDQSAPQSGIGRPAVPVAPAAPAPGQTNGAALLGPGSASEGLSGEEFLSAIPKPMADQVKALSEGRMKFPDGMSAKSPYWQGMIQAVSQYDPAFDVTDYHKRNATATAFAKGKQGDAVRSVNQTISHMGSLSDAIDKLDNFDGLGKPLNYIVNPLQDATGDPRQGVFRQRVQAVSSELRKVFSGTGGGSLQELEEWQRSMPLNASKEQQKAYLQSAVELLGGAMDALDEQYRKGMGPNANLLSSGLISEKAQKTLARLRGVGGVTPEQPHAVLDTPDLAKKAIAELERRKAAAGGQ